MSTLPASIGNWSEIETFFVEYNNLTGSLPDEIAMWSRLKRFAVRENQITGTLPNGIGQCTALEEVCAFDHSENCHASHSNVVYCFIMSYQLTSVIHIHH